MTPRVPLPLGVHVSAEGGASRAAARAAALGCGAFQFFARNPRAWAYTPLPESEVEAFRAGRAGSGIGTAAIHTMYLINLASEGREHRDRSIAAIAEDLRRAGRLGCEHVVTHLGSRREQSPSSARRRVVSALNRALRDGGDPGPLLLLENAAGQGAALGADFEELARIRAEAARPERIGFAIDSAHLFAMGVDPRVAGEMDRALGPLADRGALGALRLVHLNDSMAELGSRRDRHEHLGAGWLGRKGLFAFMSHPWIRGLPTILETPFEEAGADVRNLRYARRLLRAVLRAADPEAPPCEG